MSWVRPSPFPPLPTAAGVAAAAGVRALGSHEGLFLFVPVVMLSAWFGGLTGGLVATFAAIVSIEVFLFEPFGSTTVDNVQEVLVLVLFAAVCVSVSVLTAGRRRAVAERE